MIAGRRVLVAGGSSPIGSVIARELAARGASVAVHYRTRRSEAEEVLISLPRSAPHAALGADLTIPGALAEALVQVEATWGAPVTDVVNAAWPSHGTGPLSSTTAADLETAFQGVRMHVGLIQASIERLRRSRGSLVLLGGALASRHHPGLALFGAAKAAATVLSQALALEEGSHGVRSNVLALGRVDIGDGDLAETDPVFSSLDRIGALRRALPLPAPADVARLTAWLLSTEASAVTGQVIAVAGGEPV